MGFFDDLTSADNSKRHTPYIFLLFIGGVLMLLSIILIIYHCFWHGHGIDGETVRLILGLLGGGVLNCGASYFSKATTVIESATGGAPPRQAKLAPPEAD